MSKRRNMQLTTVVVESYLQALNCPRALTILILFRNKQFRDIVELTIDSNHYGSAAEFRDAYQATEFLSKNNFLKTGIDLKAAAMEKFYGGEESCKRVNSDPGFVSNQYGSDFEWLHNATIRKISEILGEFSAEEFVDSCDWGPGVSVDVKADTSGSNKFWIESGITRDAYDFVAPWVQQAYPSWEGVLREPVFHVGDEVVTVRKNAKTDRTIGIQPGMLLWFQKGVGGMVRSRLKRYGIDLKHGQKRNQKLARRGSLTGLIATVDFVNASGSISRNTVRSLVVHNVWFGVMDVLRSKFARIEDQVHEYEMFSSMGNGFTFELETLIFYSIALAVCERLRVCDKDVSVYGDDVILPSEAFDLFQKTCAVYGFKTNPKKSFSTGYFRESCGAHWYNGVACKPWYLKEVINNDASVYKAANSLRRLSHQNTGNLCCDGRFYATWSRLFNVIPSPRTLLTSDGHGDGAFIVNFDEAHPRVWKRRKKGQKKPVQPNVYQARFGIEGFMSRVLVASAQYNELDHVGVLIERLHAGASSVFLTQEEVRQIQARQLIVPSGQSTLQIKMKGHRRYVRDRGFGNKVPIKGRVKYPCKWILVQQWRDLGPWC
jgi:hypothetical protein